MAAPDMYDEKRLNPENSAIAAANRWLRVAIVYFVIAVAMGVFMSASEDHRLLPVHAHLNLLGWVSMALIGFIYRAFPGAATTRLAKTQFWLHNIALPPLMVGLSLFMLTGNTAVVPVLASMSIAILVSVILFAWNVLRQPN